MKYKNIAISGDIGTGKSTLGRSLAEKLDWRYISGGEHIRHWYKENGIDFAEINRVPEEVDRELEADFKQKMEVGSETIFESRLAGWLSKDMKDVFKVLCVTDFEVAMERVSKREGIGLEEAKRASKTRAEGLIAKFKKLYGVDDFLDEKYFDLVVDTTRVGSDEAMDIVLGKISA